MRYFHRLASLICCLLMIWLGTTGAIVESIDFYKLSTHAPESDLVIQSINDHKFGNPDFAVVTAQDFGAESLPGNFDYPQAFETLLASLHKYKPGLEPQFVEVRMVRGRPVGQAGLVTLKPFHLSPVAAFELGTGAPTATLALPPTFPQPFSIRQRTRDLHRYWIVNDRIGGWAEVLSGVLLWVLIVTGLVLYFRLLRFRTVKLERGNWFWHGGGWWRELHRWASVGAAVFLIVIAFSGSFLAFETAWHSVQPKHHAGEAAPLSDEDIGSMLSTTMLVTKRDERSTPIRVIRLRSYSGMKQGVVVTGEAETRQLIYNTATAQRVSLAEPGYPVSGFPLGVKMHRTMQRLHSGEIFGITAIFLNGLAGLALVFLSVSGIVVYVSMWRKRAKVGRRALVWS